MSPKFLIVIATLLVIATAGAALLLTNQTEGRATESAEPRRPTANDLDESAVERDEEGKVAIDNNDMEVADAESVRAAPDADVEDDASRPTIEELEKSVRKALDDGDTTALTTTFRELQARGEAGLSAATAFVSDIFAKFSFGDGTLEQAPGPWGTIENFLQLFTPELVRHLHANGKPTGVVLFQNLWRMDWWARDERMKFIDSVMSAVHEVDNQDWFEISGGVALMNMPGADAAGIAQRFLERRPEGHWRGRYACVWVLARYGSDEAWAVIRTVRDKDPHDQVSGTARYHLLARGLLIEGLLVVSLDPDGTAAAAGVKVGDVIQAASGKEIQYQEDLVDGERLALVIARDGARVEALCESGYHGITGYHVPPEFPK